MTKKNLSAEDSALFRKTIGKVKAVNSDNSILSSNKKPNPYPKKTEQTINDRYSESVDSEIETLFQEDSFSFTAPGLQKNVLKKLRKGYFGMSATIDLHGLTSQEAYIHLSRFLHYSVEDGYRCVHIIHGKGYRSPDKQPVLKNEVNVWLRQHKDVQAFCSAPSKHGGTGAVFVLLKLSEKYREEEDSQY